MPAVKNASKKRFPLPPKNPRAKTTQRSYQVVVDTSRNREHTELLDQTYNFYLKTSRNYQNTLLSLLGGYSPDFDLNPKSDKISKAMIALFLWFPLESSDSPAKSFVIDHNEIEEQFLMYWTGEPLSERDLQYIREYASLQYDSAIAIFVDRRRAFAEWNQNVQALPSDLNSLFSDPEFPIFGNAADSEAADSYVYVRSLFSNFWGTGEKSDKSMIQKLFSDVVEKCRWDDHPKMTKKEIVKDMERAMKMTAPDVIAVMKTGKPNALRMKLEAFADCDQSLTEAEVKNHAVFYKTMVKNVNDRAGKLSRTFSDQFKVNLLVEMEKGCGLKYTDALRDVCSEAMSLAWRRVRVFQSTACNRLLEKIELSDNLSKIECIGYLHSIVSQFEGSQAEGFVLRRGQLNGFEDFAKKINNGMKMEDAAAEIRESFEAQERQGNVGFFEAVYKESPELFSNYTPSDLNDEFHKICRHKDLVDRILHLRLGPCRFISDTSCDHPNFGNSRPVCKVMSKEVGDELVFDGIVLQLFDGKEFRMVHLACNGKRVCKEILYANMSKERVVRNDKTFNPDGRFVNTTAQILGDADSEKKVGMKLIRRGTWNGTEANRYFITLAIKLTCPERRLSDKDIRTLPNGLRILGVDLGQRDAASCGVLEVDKDDPEVQVEVNNKQIGLVPIRTCESTTIRTTYDGKDVLSHRGRQSTAEEENLLNEILQKMDCPAMERKDPSYCGDVRFVAGRVKKFMASRAPETPPSEESMLLFRKLAHLVLGREQIVDIGALTFFRVDILKYLLDMGHTVLKHFPENEEVKTWVATMQKKILCVRRERIRLTVSEILKFAVRMKCDVIAVEDLNLAPNAKSSRQTNRRNADWCASKVLDMLVQQAQLHGIAVQSVQPQFTSNLDFHTGHPAHRMYRLTGADLCADQDSDRPKFGPYKKNLHLPKSKLYNDAWERLFQKFRVNGMKELCKVIRPSEEILIPNAGGNLALHKGEIIHCDIRAAYLIARRAIRYFGGAKKEEAVESLGAT